MIKVEKLDGYIVVSNGVSSVIISKNDRWITIKRNHEDKEEKGRHLLLEDGETPADAMKRQWGVDLKGKDKPKDNPEQKEQPKTEEKPKEEEKEDLSKYTDDELQDLIDKANWEAQKLSKQKQLDVDENKDLRKINDEFDEIYKEYLRETYGSEKHQELLKKVNKIRDERTRKEMELNGEWDKEHKAELDANDEKLRKYAEEFDRREIEAITKRKQEAERIERERIDAYKSFKPAKNLDEAKETMALITGHGDNKLPSDANIERINQINKSSLEMISKYDIKEGLKTYGLGKMRGQTFMHANDELVEFSPRIVKASQSEIEQIYHNVSAPRAERLKNEVERTKERIEKNKKELLELEEKKSKGERINSWDLTWKEHQIKDNEKYLKKLEKSSMFKRWTTQTSAENFVRDTVYHEFGHVVMGRAQKKDFAGVNKAVASAMMKARKNGDIYKISEYANSNKDEFFAEVFAMRQTNQDLPDYINDMLDTVTGKKSA